MYLVYTFCMCFLTCHTMQASCGRLPYSRAGVFGACPLLWNSLWDSKEQQIWPRHICRKYVSYMFICVCVLVICFNVYCAFDCVHFRSGETHSGNAYSSGSTSPDMLTMYNMLTHVDKYLQIWLYIYILNWVLCFNCIAFAIDEGLNSY